MRLPEFPRMSNKFMGIKGNELFAPERQIYLNRGNIFEIVFLMWKNVSEGG